MLPPPNKFITKLFFQINKVYFNGAIDVRVGPSYRISIMLLQTSKPHKHNNRAHTLLMGGRIVYCDYLKAEISAGPIGKGRKVIEN